MPQPISTPTAAGIIAPLVVITEPTVERVGAWNSNGLVQAWDTSKLAMDNYLPGVADGKAGEMASIDGNV